MHRAALATLELFAFRARTPLHPTAIAKQLVAIAPHILESIGLDMALDERIPELGASANAPIAHDSGNRDAGAALTEVRPNVAFEAVTEVPFFGHLGGWNEVIASRGQYEFHDLSNLDWTWDEIRAARGAPDGHHGCNAPIGHAHRGDERAHLVQVRYGRRGYRRDNFECAGIARLVQRFDGAKNCQRRAITA